MTLPDKSPRSNPPKVGGEILQPLTAALLECVSPEEVVAAVVGRGTAVLKARAGLVALLSRDGRFLEIAGWQGYTSSSMQKWARLPLEASLPLSDVVRNNAPLYFDSRESRSAAYPHLIADSEEANPNGGGSVSLPLTARRRILGAMHFSFAEARPFTPDDGVFLDELARQCSLALERALLREELEKAQVQAEMAARRQEFLARASALLSDSLDYQTRLERLARLCVPELADWSTVDILAEDSSLLRLAVAHRVGAREAVMREAQRRFPPEAQRNSSLLTIIQRGEKVLASEITREMLEANIVEPEHVELLLRIGLHAILILPLKARDRILGAITLGLTGESETRRAFEPETLALAEELARRAAISVDNALLFQAAEVAKKRYGRLLETALEGILLINHLAQITYVNPQMARMLAYDSPEELIGRDAYALLFSEDAAHARERWEARVAGVQGEYELRLRRQDGKECWVLAHVSIDRSDEGTFLGTFTMFTDITERRRVQRELAVKNAELLTIFERVNDAFSAFDHEWRFTYVNSEAERLLGRSASDLLGKCIWDEFENARETLVYTEYLRAVREQVTVAFELYYGPLLGWFEVRAYPSPSGLSAYFRNITEKKEAELERERNQAERMHAADEKARLLAELQEAGLRQRRFLREMLFSLTEGHLQLCDTPEELPPPLPSACESITLTRPTLRTLRHQVMEVAADLGFLDERWQDLITGVGEASMNAVTHAGGGEAETRYDKETGTVQVWVRDEGQGIAENALHRATLEKGFSSAGTLGHGFWMILKTCDRCWLLTGPGGTTVVLEQDREAKQPGWLAGV